MLNLNAKGNLRLRLCILIVRDFRDPQWKMQIGILNISHSSSRENSRSRTSTSHPIAICNIVTTRELFLQFSMNLECTQSRDSFLQLHKNKNLSQIFVSWSWKPLNVGYCSASKSKDDIDTHDSLQLLDVKLSQTMFAILRKERIWWMICSGRLLNIDSSLIVVEANNSYGQSILLKFLSGKYNKTAIQIKETTLLKMKKLELDTSDSISEGLEKYIWHMNGSSVPIRIWIIIIIISSLCFISEYEWEFCSN